MDIVSEGGWQKVQVGKELVLTATLGSSVKGPGRGVCQDYSLKEGYSGGKAWKRSIMALWPGRGVHQSHALEEGYNGAVAC
jgi:hypothetical protein